MIYFISLNFTLEILDLDNTSMYNFSLYIKLFKPFKY